MAKQVCPSCGAAYNGRKCRACLYENFSEEITHRNHTHKGEPLVIDSPTRRPIPRKDPFGCETQTKKSLFPRREKKRRPFAGLFAIFLVIYALLPMVRSWGLELEAREEALVQPEMAIPEDLVTLYEEGDITISIQPRYLTNFGAEDPRIWVENASDRDVYVTTRYVMANGFVLPSSGVYVDAAAGLYGMGTLYLYEEELNAANIREVEELTFVLEVVDDGDYAVLFTTDPITLSATGRPVEPQWTVEGGLPLIDEDGLYMEALGYFPEPDDLKYENGCLLFYVENNTDAFLSMNSLETAIGGEKADLFLWADLPAHSRSVIRMDLWALEDWKITSPTELGDLTMTVEFWDAENYSGSVTEFTVTMPMVRETPLVFH
ncbi:MAG: hypothetical protein J6J12_09905 [Oscillospiraceae bacterium]|nr:hypothetical protein [Oscillospiraceae bacterium]